MKRMIGFIMFWIAIGMTIMLFINETFLTACVIAALIIIGYNLFCC